MWQQSYRPEVEHDVVDAVTWYDDKRPGLGDEFLLEFLAAIPRVRDNPLLFSIAETDCGLAGWSGSLTSYILTSMEPTFWWLPS